MPATALQRRPVGVLLVNVGTPESPDAGAVRRYLREFLSDSRVVDMNPIGRWLLLNLIILPFRPRRSAEAYRKVWTDQGSPLLVLGRRFEAALQTTLGSGFRVALAHRYGQPSVDGAMARLADAGVGRVVVFPLYPQLAASTTGTTLARVYALAAKRWSVPNLAVVPPFFADPGFVAAFAARGRPPMAALNPDHVLFSFHGLPERHIKKSATKPEHCLADESCCNSLGPHNAECYRAQCFATARSIAAALDLRRGSWTVAFQSRLGRDPWIRPYADQTIATLAKKGVKRLLVYCPAFVADCLETLEEIGMGQKEAFLSAGGEAFSLVPSLNDSPAWVEAAAALVRDTARG